MAITSPDWVPAAAHRWETALSGLHADALDCLQSTLALIADEAHGADTHLALGARVRFPTRHRDGAIHVQSSLPERLDEAVDLLGLRIAAPHGPVGAPHVRRRLAEAGPLYVVADAYDLPWVPYTGHRHMSHSFLLEEGPAGYTVVDAYHNDTEWGPARPGAWTASTEALDAALSGGALTTVVEAGPTPPQIDRATVLAQNAARAQAAAPDIEGYVFAVRTRMDRPEVIERLVLDVWLLGRERLLHAAWLGGHPAAAEVAASAEAWQRLAAQSYLAMRRALRGGPRSDAVLDDMAHQLHADAALVTRLAVMPVTGRDSVVRVVRDALRHTLEVDDHAIDRVDSLRALPGFNSFRLVDIIDQIERRLGVRMPADASANDLFDLNGLCRLFAGTTSNGAGRHAR